MENVANSYRTIHYDDLNKEQQNEVCAICRDGFNASRKIKVHNNQELNFNKLHPIHKSCIIGFAEASLNLTCPTCKMEIDKSSLFSNKKVQKLEIKEIINQMLKNDKYQIKDDGIVCNYISDEEIIYKLSNPTELYKPIEEIKDEIEDKIKNYVLKKAKFIYCANMLQGALISNIFVNDSFNITTFKAYAYGIIWSLGILGFINSLPLKDGHRGNYLKTIILSQAINLYVIDYLGLATISDLPWSMFSLLTAAGTAYSSNRYSFSFYNTNNPAGCFCYMIGGAMLTQIPRMIVNFMSNKLF